MTATQVAADVIELTTTVRFTGADASAAGQIAAELDSALRAEINEQGAAAVKQYFVRPVGVTVQVGLRFSGMDPDHVEATADDLLEGALANVPTLNMAISRGKRTNTLLVGA